LNQDSSLYFSKVIYFIQIFQIFLNFISQS
jgi:hypothetical protein